MVKNKEHSSFDPHHEHDQCHYVRHLFPTMPCHQDARPHGHRSLRGCVRPSFLAAANPGLQRCPLVHGAVLWHISYSWGSKGGILQSFAISLLMAVFKVVRMSHDELLYYDLIFDTSVAAVVKVQVNHNMEFMFKLFGHMSPTFCHVNNIVGQLQLDH